MFKDPLQTQPTPYEILGLPYSAPLSLVKNALPTFMKGEGRRKPHLLGAAQQAARKLQSPKERARVDIFLYNFRPLEDEKDEAIGLDLNGLGYPVAADPVEMYCPMDPARGIDETRAISVRTLKFTEIKLFDSGQANLFQPSFER